MCAGHYAAGLGHGSLYMGISKWHMAGLGYARVQMDMSMPPNTDGCEQACLCPPCSITRTPEVHNNCSCATMVALRHGRCANRHAQAALWYHWIGQAHKRHICAAMCWCWYVNRPVCHPVSAWEHGKCMNRYAHTTKLRCWDTAGSSPHFHMVWLCWV